MNKFWIAIVLVFIGCFASPRLEQESKFYQDLPEKGAILTFRNGVKCHLPDFTFNYFIDATEESGDSVVTYNIKRVYEQNENDLILENTDQGAVILNKDNLDTLSIFYKDHTFEDKDAIASSAKINLKNGKIYEIKPVKDQLLKAYSDFSWNLNGHVPEQIFINGDFSNCNIEIQKEMKISFTKFYSSTALIRIKFL